MVDAFVLYPGTIFLIVNFYNYFWRHKRLSADESARIVAFLLDHKSEVSNLHLRAIFTAKYILQLDVSMSKFQVVHVLNPVTNFKENLHDSEFFWSGKPSIEALFRGLLQNVILQAHAVALHQDVQILVRFLVGVVFYDVWMFKF